MAEALTSAKTVVGLFETKEDANRAADELVREGFSHEQVGVIAGHELSHAEEHVTAPEDSETKVVGTPSGRVSDLEGSSAPLRAGRQRCCSPGWDPLSSEVLSRPHFSARVWERPSAALWPGLMSAGVDESDARLFEEGLRHGGVVLTVHTDEAIVRRAVHILFDRNGALDMDEHRQRWGDKASTARKVQSTVAGTIPTAHTRGIVLAPATQQQTSKPRRRRTMPNVSRPGRIACRDSWCRAGSEQLRR